MAGILALRKRVFRRTGAVLTPAAAGFLVLLMPCAARSTDALEPAAARQLLARLLSEDDARRLTAREGILQSRDRTLLPALTDALFFASAAHRSNKLMYDEGTLSLWSNLTGEPVGGRLLDSGIRLPMLPLTVTSWKEWRRRHPETRVVSPKTGYDRDYSVGAAYGGYFASPDSMFPVWKRASALEPKARVYALRNGSAARAYPLEALLAERVVNDRVGALPVVLVADPEARSVRAYLRGGRELAQGPQGELVDPQDGNRFRVEEEVLAPLAPGASRLPRYPGHLAYWFGWYAFFPETALYEGCPISAAGP